MAWVHAGLWSDSLASQFGGQYTGGPVTVLEHGTSTVATLYSDRTKAQTVANPTHTDALGNLLIYAEPGMYDLATPGSEGAAFFTLAVAPDQADLAGSGSSAVTSFNSRTGAVVPVAGDYPPSLIGAVALATVDAKGDLLVGVADNMIARLPVGADGQVLTADSTQTDGVKWAPGGGGGGAVSSVFTRTGAVTAQTGDYTAAQVGADPSGAAAGALAAAESYTDSAVTPLAPKASPTFTGTATLVNTTLTGRAMENIHDLGNSGAGTVTPDASLGNFMKVTATGTFILAAPINPPAAGKIQKLWLEVVQDGTGGHDWTQTGIGLGSDISAWPALSTGAGKRDLIGLLYDGTSWLLVAYSRGY